MYFLWKDSFRRSFDMTVPESTKIQAKASVLDAISGSDKNKIVVSYPEAIVEKIIKQDAFEKSKLTFKIGEEVDLDFLIEVLNEYAFFQRRLCV